MKQLSLIICSLFITTNFAQNLVPNPSFENRTADFCGIMNNADLAIIIDDWYVPTQSSPDLYFTNIDSSCFNFMQNSTYGGPIGLKGSQNPRTGEVMAGIVLYSISGLSQREYLQIELNSPLIVGQNYIVECYVSLADSIEFATDQLGIYLSTQAVSLQNNGVLNYTPQVIASGIIAESQEWILISDTIIATEAHEFLTIGNFSSDAQTPTVPNTTHSNGIGTYGSYYYVDDVRVELLRGLNTVENEMQNAKNRKLLKIIDFMGRETEFKPNTPLIYIYSDGTRERVFKRNNE